MEELCGGAGRPGPDAETIIGYRGGVLCFRRVQRRRSSIVKAVTENLAAREGLKSTTFVLPRTIANFCLNCQRYQPFATEPSCILPIFTENQRGHVLVAMVVSRSSESRKEVAAYNRGEISLDFVLPDSYHSPTTASELSEVAEIASAIRLNLLSPERLQLGFPRGKSVSVPETEFCRGR